MSPWGTAPQWCSVTVDVGQCFVCVAHVCPCPTAVHILGRFLRIFFLNVRKVFSDHSDWLLDVFLCPSCFLWVQQPTEDVCDYAAAEFAFSSEVLLCEAGSGRLRGNSSQRGEVGCWVFMCVGWGMEGISPHISQHSDIWLMFSDDVTVPSAD